MQVAKTNTVLFIIALAAVSLLALNFSGAATTTSTAPARHYYLTKAAFNGNQVLTACTSGYHFASYAELSDPAFLTYNKSLGRSQPDYVAGPPDCLLGWLRSGWVSNSDNSTGDPTNCSLWTSGSGSDYGEFGEFAPHFNSSNELAQPVYTFSQNGACDNSQGFNIGVWCVEN